MGFEVARLIMLVARLCQSYEEGRALSSRLCVAPPSEILD
jgi:hypothetical protein